MGDRTPAFDEVPVGSPQGDAGQPDAPVPGTQMRGLPSWLALARGRALIVATVLLTIIFMVLTAIVLRSDLKPTAWDVYITHQVQELPEVVRVPLEWVSAPGFMPWNFIMPVVIMGVMLLWRWYTEAVFTILGGVGGLLSEVVKNLVDRPRPSVDYGAVVVRISDSYSFPSGHVTSYVTLFGTLFYLAYTLLPRKHPFRWAVLVLTAALVILVGPSRVSMGAHWSSDAMAGYALGFAYLLLLIEVYRAWQKRHPKVSPDAPTAEGAVAVSTNPPATS